MDNTEVAISGEQHRFSQDTDILAEQFTKLLQTTSPYYLADIQENILEHVEKDSAKLLDQMAFFKIASCTTEKMDDIREFLNSKMEKFLTAVHSLQITVAYGIVSYGGEMHLVLGVNSKHDADSVVTMIKGGLSGIELNETEFNFTNRSEVKQHHGLIMGIPSFEINNEPQTFDLSAIMNSLYGQNFTLFFLAKPVSRAEVADKYSSLIDVRDQCFAISKRNIQRQQSTTMTDTTAENTSETKGSSTSYNLAGVGAWAGAAIGAKIGGQAGVGVGAAIGGMIGSSITRSNNKSITTGLSKAISEATTQGENIGIETQNGFALEIMNYADTAIERLKHAQSSGLWETAIAFSSDSLTSRNILQASLYAEIAKPNENLLPPQAFLIDLTEEEGEDMEILVPKNILQPDEKGAGTIASFINTKELGLLFSLPDQQTPGFELKESTHYPTVGTDVSVNPIQVGHVSDETRVIENMPFGFSEADINKHTFVCGITGSGKTTTVKRILEESKKPFLVIESAKKEYRHMKLQDSVKMTVYTLGKPEINCLKMNPFYIMPGISPQTHIDYLKDLFNAAFSFYGPMPYILEKCLHNIYENKGWDLTLGYHPYIMNTKNQYDFFDNSHMKQQYSIPAHRFLFPTMEDLKIEVERYIEKEMDYEGEVAGNIKTAIKARLESLTTGAKGYMFNTTEYVDMEKLLNGNVVLELEGLADDADKAFCVGLLVIFISEYRHVAKELSGPERLGLEHILVIEEAHRLLKNVETGRTSENMGNPIGKAVEHFTNMIAEMRAYGQGVIIAEQIPTKLAPDVIKNSSNKIIHRIVSADDQHVIANTIGIREEDGIYLGQMNTGLALCHKEGMHLPMRVQIHPTEDCYVSDGMLYERKIEDRFRDVNLSMMKNLLADDFRLYRVKLFNSLMLDEEIAIESIRKVKRIFQAKLKQKMFTPLMMQEVNELVSLLLRDYLTSHLMHGVYSIEQILPTELYEKLYEVLRYEQVSALRELQEELKELYGEATSSFVIYYVSEQLKREDIKKIDVLKSIKAQFIIVDEQTVNAIHARVRG